MGSAAIPGVQDVGQRDLDPFERVLITHKHVVGLNNLDLAAAHNGMSPGHPSASKLMPVITAAK